MFLFFIIIFILIGTTGVLVFAYVGEGFPLIVCEFALLWVLMTILEWRDYVKRTKIAKENSKEIKERQKEK